MLHQNIVSWSRLSLVLLILMISLAAWVVGETYMATDFRIELHEQGHLRAYRAQGIYAYRSSFTRVHTIRRTIEGASGGYRAEIGLLWFAAVVTGVGGLLMNFMTGYPFFSAGITATASAWWALYKHMITSSDARNLQTMMVPRRTLEAIAYEIAQPALRMILFMRALHVL